MSALKALKAIKKSATDIEAEKTAKKKECILCSLISANSAKDADPKTTCSCVELIYTVCEKCYNEEKGANLIGSLSHQIGLALFDARMKNGQQCTSYCTTCHACEIKDHEQLMEEGEE